DQQSLFDLLTSISGHLKITSSQDEKLFESLQENLAEALPGEDITSVKNNFFSVEGSDLFFNEAISPNRLSRLKDASARISAKDESKSSLRVFVREVPIRSTQLKGSVPAWANGAAVEKTIGPFTNKDGRKIWFDFYRIEKLIALYFENENDPAVLFNVSLLKRFLINNLPPVIDPAAKYKLVPDSIWINAKHLASNSPQGFYAGLKIKGGDITLGAAPQIINNKLTITSDTNIFVTLELDQPEVKGADDSSPYGIDARNSKINMPKSLQFHFTAHSSTVDEINGEVNWNVYGQEASFDWNKNNSPNFNQTLNRVLIPFDCSEDNFSVENCESTFNNLSESAKIQMSAWALPVAQIDVTKPSPAAGIGGLVIQCEKGLLTKWSGLNNGDINLSSPFVLCDIGRINITDLQASNINSTQEYKLWKDDINKFGSTIKLQFSKAFPFLYNTLANGTETLLTQTNTNPLIDRPVTVLGNPLDIHSKNSFLLLAVSKTFKLIYLYDDNIIFDNLDPNKPNETLPKPISLALSNALFKVTPVNGCLLFGELADDWVKIKNGFLFLTFGMYAYLPSLPDPYAANLNKLKYQFRGTRLTDTFVGQTIWLWLVCQTKWEPKTEEKDKVEVSFHFAPLENQFQVIYSAAAQPASADSSSSNLQKNNFVKLFAPNNVEQDSLNLSENLKENSSINNAASYSYQRGNIDLEDLWDKAFSLFLDDVFALLDVSSNADQMGISFASFEQQRTDLVRTFSLSTDENQNVNFQFPLQVNGMDVVTRGLFAKAFTVPQISWEPVLNLTDPKVINPTNPNLEPPLGQNYYPNDGGPTRILNNSTQFVPLAPIPLVDFIIEKFKNEKGNVTASLFNLPFGMKAITVLNKDADPGKPPTIEKIEHEFSKDIKTGIQIQFNAGMLSTDVYPLFHGG
ncbi:MAG: hypothetical protein ABI550_08960, partial [Ignavibacteriaceae bacterium]